MSLSSRQLVSLEGEKFVIDKVKGMGISVTQVSDFFSENCDLIVAGRIPVEVKLAKKTYRCTRLSGGRYMWRPRWQWSISDTCTKMSGIDWVLCLLAETKGHTYSYVMPGAVACQGGRRHIQITSHPDSYSGWLSDWLGRWDIFPYLCQETYMDGGPLFDHVQLEKVSP